MYETCAKVTPGSRIGLIMKKLAIIVSNGSFNNIEQVATFAMAAAVCEIKVRIFFRDEAVLKMTKTHINDFNLSSGYKEPAQDAFKRFQSAKVGDLQGLWQEVKKQGDVKLYACTSSMFLCGVNKEALVPEIDEPRGLTSFLLEEMNDADQVLTF